jgi:hypothetical protein
MIGFDLRIYCGLSAHHYDLTDTGVRGRHHSSLGIGKVVDSELEPKCQIKTNISDGIVTIDGESELG